MINSGKEWDWMDDEDELEDFERIFNKNFF